MDKKKILIVILVGLMILPNLFAVGSASKSSDDEQKDFTKLFLAALIIMIFGGVFFFFGAYPFAALILIADLIFVGMTLAEYIVTYILA